MNPFSRGNDTELGAVLITNRDTNNHVVDFCVEWDGEMVHDRTYEIEAKAPESHRTPGTTPERTWSDSAGSFTVSARLDGGDWQSTSPAEWDRPGCLGVTADINPEGRLALFVTTNPNECSAEATESGETNISSNDS